MTAKDIISNGKLVVESRIEDEFQGFDDGMLFALLNGQYWLQAEYKYWYHYAYMPTIRIYSIHGAYYLSIEGKEQIVKVALVMDVVKATIINDFNGWSGDTVFQLDNGQIWKQSEYAYRYQYAYRPKAIIYKVGGSHKLVVQGKKIDVRRIK